LLEAIAALWTAGAATVGHRFPPGVYRHRSIESLNALTERMGAGERRAFHATRTPALPRLAPLVRQRAVRHEQHNRLAG